MFICFKKWFKIQSFTSKSQLCEILYTLSNIFIEMITDLPPIYLLQ